MQITIKRILAELLGAIGFSVCLSIGIYYLSKWLEAIKPTLNLGGDKAGIFGVIFIGMPIGFLLGILLVDKIIFKFEGYNCFGIAVGFILAFLFGGIASVFLLDEIGKYAVLVIPLIILALSFVGYYCPLLIKQL